MVLVFLIPLFVVPSQARTWRIRDGGDARGPLNIRKVEYRHGPRRNYIDVTLEQWLNPNVHRGERFFVVDVDHTGDRRGDAWIYVYPSWDRAYRTFVYYPRHDEVHKHRGVWVKELDYKSFRVGFEPSRLTYSYDSVDSYVFRVAAFYRSRKLCKAGCIDMAPNGGWQLHDMADPVAWVQAPELSVFPSPKIRAKWSGRDEGWAGLAERRLRYSKKGSDNWHTVARSLTKGESSSVFAAKEGITYRVQSRVRDRVGNVGHYTRQVGIPHDDTSSAFDAQWTGGWLAPANERTFQRTEHISVTPQASFSFTAKAKTYCIAYRTGEEFGTLDVQIDGDRQMSIPQGVVDEPLLRQHECYEMWTSEERTVTATARLDGLGSSEPVNIDGYWAD
jgi:hypothetical protein